MKYSLALLLLVPFAAPLSAQTVTYHIELFGDQEVPPVTTGGFGTAMVTVDTASGAVRVSGSYQSLSSIAVAGHLHAVARRGVNAGVALPFSVSGGTSGTFTASGTLSAGNLQALLDGLTYINIHTGQHPGGEIRGQVDTVPGSGGSGAAPMVITGDATGGGTLVAGCPPTINQSFVLLGLALPPLQTLPLFGVGCGGTTLELGMDVIITPFAVNGTQMTAPIPAGITNLDVAFQCVFMTGGGCFDMSMATRVAIRP